MEKLSTAPEWKNHFVFLLPELAWVPVAYEVLSEQRSESIRGWGRARMVTILDESLEYDSLKYDSPEGLFLYKIREQEKSPLLATELIRLKAFGKKHAEDLQDKILSQADRLKPVQVVCWVCGQEDTQRKGENGQFERIDPFGRPVHKGKCYDVAFYEAVALVKEDTAKKDDLLTSASKEVCRLAADFESADKARAFGLGVTRG
jgi:hypothetical protein